ncbi:hypothetical protein, partial [Mesorhizobium sp. M4A.F.Ca.ET.050.02.1.1]|uniref:hypothetical protein n=1 Tax=Mesorhizobium sp. M4A.F.Ca.ET.050.02.1.1 TaxID=2496754 RepID=UPI001AECC959
MPNGRPAPAAANRLNISLKSLPSLGGGRNNFSFLNNDLQALISLRFVSYRAIVPDQRIFQLDATGEGRAANYSEQDHGC